jgi:phosphoribosylamine--glycine ligase
MMRFDADLFPVLLACSRGGLDQVTISFRKEAAMCVVMAANGYPSDYQKGSEIRGLDKANARPDTKVFHAGTKAEAGKILANGGRVLGVTALGETIAKAQENAYAAVDMIDWPEGFCRRDIGWRAIKS